MVDKDYIFFFFKKEITLYWSFVVREKIRVVK